MVPMKPGKVYGAIDTVDTQPRTPQLTNNQSDSPARFNGLWSATLAVIGAIFFLLASSAANSAATSAPGRGSISGSSKFEARGEPSANESSSKSASFHASLDLLENDRVIDFIRFQTGVYDISNLDDEVLYSLVPSKITIEGDTNLMKGAAGEHADKGSAITTPSRIRSARPLVHSPAYALLS